MDYDEHYDISQKWSNKFLYYANNIALYNINIILGTELRIQGAAAGAIIETPVVSWNHIIKRGFWCIPCCILDENIHPKMKVCSSMPNHEDICKQQNIHGRCGIEFDPWEQQIK